MSLPTTTAAVAVLAAAELDALRRAADLQHALALKARGTADALQRAACIDNLHQQLLGVACLYSVLHGLGDTAAADAFQEDWRKTGAYLREAGTTARMCAVPGWDPATRTFAKPRAAAPEAA